MKVLIVDDDPVIQLTLESNLSKWGYQPLVAENAEAGWDILQNLDAPQLAIIDWRLPKMNGIELCKLIKSRESSFCYIIMLTGRMSSDDMTIGLESGADDYIVKPVDAIELKARLMVGKRILDKMQKISPNLHSTDPKKPAKTGITIDNNFFSPQILIAEDDPVSREVLQENLISWGFSVIVTENGQQAVEAFKNHHGSLLGIIDWMMPQLSGIDACRQIKELAEQGLCYLILLTAKNQREDIVLGLESGADDYLTKPFHATELRARINAGIRILTANLHLKAIVYNCSEGIASLSEQGEIDSFNPAAEKMFGYKAYEILNCTIFSLLANDNDKESLRHQMASATADSSYQLELTGSKKNTACFPLAVNMAQMNYNGNKHFVCMMRDITEQKEREKKLFLEKEIAELATQAKSQFLSKMSHELKTPLNAILGFAQLLDSDTQFPLPEQQHQFLDYILKEGRHLLGVINEIIDLVKIETGKISLNYTAIEVDDLLWECIALFDSLAANQNITISYSMTTLENWVKADDRHLKQVLINLLSNAIKYNSQPGNIFIEKSQPTASIIRISITDTGKGIPAEKQHGLFQAFSHLEEASCNNEGAGIGLLISKNLVEKMGGEIGFASEVGKGSSFWIELPILAKPESIAT